MLFFFFLFFKFPVLFLGLEKRCECICLSVVLKYCSGGIKSFVCEIQSPVPPLYLNRNV